MASRRVRALVGAAMILVGVVQAILFAVQREPIPFGLGLAYAGVGVAYLWAEVYTVDT